MCRAAGRLPQLRHPAQANRNNLCRWRAPLFQQSTYLQEGRNGFVQRFHLRIIGTVIEQEARSGHCSIGGRRFPIVVREIRSAGIALPLRFGLGSIGKIAVALFDLWKCYGFVILGKRTFAKTYLVTERRELHGERH